MSTERPEFRPIESAPSRRMWPYAVLGALIVGVLAYVAHRNVSQPSESRPVTAAATVAPRIDPVAATKVEPEKTAQKAPEGPNVLGAAVATASKIAMVARSELDRELARTTTARKQADAYRKQVENLEKQLNEARAQLAAMQKASRPPPPSDQEQILQMLAPVLRSANNGRP
jgi:hypothetical protein